jgi:hypothetical protein
MVDPHPVCGIHKVDRHSRQRPRLAGELAGPAQPDQRGEPRGNGAPGSDRVAYSPPKYQLIADEHQGPRIRNLPVRCGEDLPRSCDVVPAWEEPTPPMAWKIE